MELADGMPYAELAGQSPTSVRDERQHVADADRHTTHLPGSGPSSAPTDTIRRSRTRRGRVQFKKLCDCIRTISRLQDQACLCIEKMQMIDRHRELQLLQTRKADARRTTGDDRMASQPHMNQGI